MAASKEDPAEREILAPVDVADSDGRLQRDAVGWSRHPLHGVRLPPGLSRVAAWNYWCVVSRDAALTVLVADVGYFGVALLSLLDFVRSSPVDRLHVRPRGLGFPMPPTPTGDIVVDVRRLHLAMVADGDTLRIKAQARTFLGTKLVVDLDIARPGAHETLNVLVPFGDTAFQFTSKQQALPARGVVRVGAREHRFGPESDSFACLDFGRGRWPSRVEWSWAFGATTAGGRTVGMNLGGQWTDGTGVTENGFVVDGRLHKIAEAVNFECDRRAFMKPWRIRTRGSARVDLRFTPRTERAVKVPLGIAGVELQQHMGVFEGSLVDDTGHVVAVDGMTGLAESFRGKW